MNGFPSPSVAGVAQYDPNVPPDIASPYNDEFDDGSLSGWVAPSYNTNFNMLQTSGAVHLSESVMPGYLLIQGDLASSGVYNFYKPFTPSTTQAFTVVVKISMGQYLIAAERFISFGFRGNADNVYYEVRVGRNNSSQYVRTVYANGGAGAEGTGSLQSISSTVYIMIVCDGAKNFSSFISSDGVGWSGAELNRSLSSITSFTRLGIGHAGTGSVNGISAVDFVRYFPVAGQYKIGL